MKNKENTKKIMANKAIEGPTMPAPLKLQLL